MHSRVEVLSSSSSSSTSAFESCPSFHSTSPTSRAVSSSFSSLSSSFSSLNLLNQLNIKNTDHKMIENKLNEHKTNQEQKEDKTELVDECLTHNNKEGSNNNNSASTSHDNNQQVNEEHSNKINNNAVEIEEVNVTNCNNVDDDHRDVSSNSSSSNSRESSIGNEKNRTNENETNEAKNSDNDEDEDDDDNYNNGYIHEVDVEECARLKIEGNKLFTAGDVDGALSNYRQAIAKAEIKPFRSPQATNTSSSSVNTGDISDNKDNIVDTDNDDHMHKYTLTAQVFCNAGYCLMKLGETKDAEPMLSEAIRHQPNYLKALLRRADCYYLLEKWSSAFGDFESYEKHGGVLSANDQQRKVIAKGKMDAEMQKMLGELKDLGNKFLGNFGLSTDNFKFDKDPKTGGYSMRFEREKLLT